MSFDTCDPGQLFTSARDALVDECMVEEMFSSMIAKHPFHVLNQTKGTDLYGDPSGEPVYDQTFEIPVQVKLDPEVEDLNKYGYDRTREAILWFSRKIMKDLSITPKVGDRLDYTYRTPTGEVVNEHLIINEISPEFQRQSTQYYQLFAAANRTHKLYKPDPPGVPADPDSLPQDVTCLDDM